MNRKIKRLRPDRGGEYNLFDELFEKQGIMHELTPPYSLKSNGIVKRKNRMLKEMINALSVSSSTLDNL